MDERSSLGIVLLYQRYWRPGVSPKKSSGSRTVYQPFRRGSLGPGTSRRVPRMSTGRDRSREGHRRTSNWLSSQPAYPEVQAFEQNFDTKWDLVWFNDSMNDAVWALPTVRIRERKVRRGRECSLVRNTLYSLRFTAALGPS